MFKKSVKPRKSAWVPPPGRSCKIKNLSKAEDKSEADSTQAVKSVIASEDASEVTSVCSSVSFDESRGDLSIYLSDIKQEHRMLNLYYMSLRPVSQFLNRLTSNINLRDTTVQKLLTKVEVVLNSLFTSFEDLEFSISFFENALFGEKKSDDLMKIVKLKENLLKKLLECYTDLINVFQVVLESLSSHDSKELERKQNSFTQQYQILEKRYQTQAATLKDLERKLSIVQGKYQAVESYNITLEETKADLQQMIHHKDAQIKSLNSEITKLSFKQDDEKWIEMMEEIRIKTQMEKKALKKALKVQKLIINEKNENLRMIEDEKEKKVQMLLDLASERDKLKVHMTVTNNELVQARYQVEEIKSQKLKLQNELSECEVSYKTKLQEECEVFKRQLNEKGENELKLMKTVKNLEEELGTADKELKALKSSHENVKASLLQAQNDCSVEKVFDEVKSLTSLLQDTKEHFQNFRTADIGALGDVVFNERNPNMDSIVAMMQDMKKELLELKRPSVFENQRRNSNESELLKQLEEFKQLQKTVSEENAALKSRIREMESASNRELYTARESYSTNNMDSNFPARDFELQLALKDGEIRKYKQRERKLEDQLDEVKDKLQKKEMENVRLFSLEESLRKCEEELRSKKLELSLLEQRKQDESERLLKRTKELQEALDDMTAEKEMLNRYVTKLNVSLYNVFGGS